MARKTTKILSFVPELALCSSRTNSGTAGLNKAAEFGQIFSWPHATQLLHTSVTLIWKKNSVKPRQKHALY